MLFAMLMVTDSVSVTITGDILLDRGVRKVIEQKGTDAVFSPFVDSVFQSSDIVIGNLSVLPRRSWSPHSSSLSSVPSRNGSLP